MNKVQLATQQENRIKAFVYEWYSRFDKGTDMETLKPFLPDEVVEFVYPQETLTSVSELVKYATKTFDFIKSSAHYIDEIFVFEIGENKYEVICPHSYHALQQSGEYINMDFIGRMRLDTALKTALDPEAKNIKVTAYKVALQGQVKPSSQDKIDAINLSTHSETDAKAFVHNWFAHIDVGNAETLMTMTSDSELNINILGNQMTSKNELKSFLLLQKDSQTYSSHKPQNIIASKTNDGFIVKFVLHFEGEINEMGLMHLSNITTWKLIDENNQLKLKEYTLEIL